MASDKANKIFEVILDELTSRSGLDDVWDSIDEETQEEITQTCAELVDEELKEFNTLIEEFRLLLIEDDFSKHIERENRFRKLFGLPLMKDDWK